MTNLLRFSQLVGMEPGNLVQRSYALNYQPHGLLKHLWVCGHLGTSAGTYARPMVLFMLKMSASAHYHWLEFQVNEKIFLHSKNITILVDSVIVSIPVYFSSTFEVYQLRGTFITA